ncbi:MAG TPA: YidC/Oxa1 family membrane protein insertase [Clostridia bacterium]|nr:YidC/Oxa1 family membrane protein insertase [Clostridia bacterium]
MNIWQWFIHLLSTVIELIYGLVQSHGWSIVLFTLLIKVLVMPLDLKSRRSMRRMSEVNPKIQALQKKYANDKEKFQQKQAELYRKEKINPLAGCLPMLLSMPVLFAMFAVMRNVANNQLADLLTALYNAVGNLTDKNEILAAIHQIQASGAFHFEPWLWIKNLWMADSPFTSVLPLTATDLMNIKGVVNADMFTALETFITGDVYQSIVLPVFNAVPLPGGTANFLLFQVTIYQNPNGFFILPVLAAVSQYLSTLMTPQQDTSGSDASKGTGQMMKYFFPLFSLWICSTSNAAFALYWVMANLFQMAEQFVFNRYFNWEDRKKRQVAEEAETK